MAPTLHTIDLREPLATRLADLVLSLSPHASDGDLAGGLVLLPSLRACASLRHALLERAGRDALLLPEIVTPRQLVAQLAGRLGLGGALAAAPPDELRALPLAGRLSRLTWAARHPESAAGLAAELVRAFDEVRRAGRGALLAGDEPAELDQLPAEQRALAVADLARLREAWTLYREAVAADTVDVLVAVAERLDAGGWPGPADGPVVVAGFAELDAATARVARVALARGDGRRGHVVDAGADGALARSFLDTFTDPQAPSHPLAPARRVRAALAPQERGEPQAGHHAGDPHLEFLACADPEDEGRTVAAVVCEALARDGADRRLAVATYDVALARRVGAQLRDAGVDFDDTAGRPLSAQPAGRFARSLVQCAVTGLKHEPLLEALTHPYANLLGKRAAHSRRALLLERLVLRGEAPPLGLADYRRRAAQQDAAYVAHRPGATAGLAAFVEAIAAALAPLLDEPAGPLPWARRLASLRRAWAALAPGHPLAAGERARLDDDSVKRDDSLPALGDLLEQLELQATTGALGEVARDEFAAALDRLLAATPVRPRRAALRPVQVMGLLEARLERFDLLVVCGLNEQVFPGRVSRPLLLGEPARRALGLPIWRDGLALRGELFLRALHAGDRVVLTWSREREGQPALPSPLVERVTLGLGLKQPEAAARRPLRRRSPPDLDAIRAAQRAFAAESPEVPALAPAAPLHHASHSALASYRACPYRFLLERGFGLAAPEEIVEEFRRLDHGQAVHECLRRLLEPGGEGIACLRRGDRAAALAWLRDIAGAEFGRAAAGLPQRRLWEETFLAAAPAVVDCEIARLTAWEPRALEREFRLPLAELHAWLAAEAAGAGDPPPPPLAAEAARIELKGKVDRVDRSRRDADCLAVIDYKTGSRVPKQRDIERGDEPQLVLYAVAVECGRLAGLAAARPRVVEAFYYKIADGAVEPKPHLDLTAGKTGRAPLRLGAQRLLAETLAAREPAGPFPLIPASRAEDATGELPCLLCPHRGICRIDERALPWAVRARLAEGRRRW